VRAGWVAGGLLLFWEKKDNRCGLSHHQIQNPRRKTAPGHAITRCRIRGAGNAGKSHLRTFREATKWRVADLRCVRRVAELAGGERTHIATGHACQPKSRQGPRRSTIEMNPTVQVNEELREFLREWRRNAARQKMTAAFVVSHDATLDALARRGQDPDRMRRVSGMERRSAKCTGRDSGSVPAIWAGERASKEWHARPSTPSLETLELLEKGHSLRRLPRFAGGKCAP